MGRAVWLVSVAALAVLLVGCQASKPPAPKVSAQSSSAVPSAAKLVWNGSYAEHIQPVFDRRCVSCHGESRAENGLKLTDHTEVMKGTQYGPVVIPGSPAGSTLLAVVKGTTDPSIRMPHGGQQLSEVEIQNLTLWIEADAPSE